MKKRETGRLILLSLSLFILLTTPYALRPTPAHAACCKCRATDAPGETLCLTDPSTGCPEMVTKFVSTNKQLSNVTCDPTPLDAATACQPISSGKPSAICASGPTSAAGYVSKAAGQSTARVQTAVPIELNVPIPGLRFAQGVTEQNGFLVVPFLAQYVSAGFRYLLGIIVITGAVMIIYGGFKYVLSSTVSGIKSGQEVIKDAVIGMIIAFGIVTVLQTLNPATSQLSALKVRVVSQESFQAFASAQMTTEAATVSGTPGSAEASAAMTACPFTLSQPLLLAENLGSPENQKIAQAWGMTSLNIRQDRRAQEFFQNVRAFVSGKSLEERMSLIANAAVACGVHLMSCGETSGTIWELAGIGDNACLSVEGTKKTSCNPGFAGCPSCNPHENYFGRKNPGPKTATILQLTTAAQQAMFNSLKCANECGEKARNLPNCISDKGKAIAFVRAEMNKIDGYPDKFLNDLKPGDIIQVYTGNSSCGGGHSALFFGWTSGGAAQVIQGEFGKKVSAGTLCIKKSCGDNMLPLVGIKKPNVAK